MANFSEVTPNPTIRHPAPQNRSRADVAPASAIVVCLIKAGDSAIFRQNGRSVAKTPVSWRNKVNTPYRTRRVPAYSRDMNNENLDSNKWSASTKPPLANWKRFHLLEIIWAIAVLVLMFFIIKDMNN
jgi:hypothetical protein